MAGRDARRSINTATQMLPSKSSIIGPETINIVIGSGDGAMKAPSARMMMHRVSPRFAERVGRQDADLHQDDHHDGQLERQTEDQHELRGKGEVGADRPVRIEAHVDGIVVQPAQGQRQDVVETKEHSAQEQRENSPDDWQEVSFFLMAERGQDKSGEEIKLERKGQDDPGIERQGQRDVHGIRRSEGVQFKVVSEHGVNRRFHDPDQLEAKPEAQHHPQAQRGDHLDEHPAQVFEVVQEGFDHLHVLALAGGEKLPEDGPDEHWANGTGGREGEIAEKALRFKLTGGKKTRSNMLAAREGTAYDAREFHKMGSHFPL